jgi:SAM-dependent methyltransferase
MRHIKADEELRDRILRDESLTGLTSERLRDTYEQVSLRFHSHFRSQAQAQHENALYHRIRYLKLLERRWQGRVLDVGNDKPFLSYFLQAFNPDTRFETISNEIPESPIPLYEVDIEQEKFPFDNETFDMVIFTEVIEHLWRDPSQCMAEISRVMRIGGEAYITTPNPCDRHSLVCVLWQANPNQRSGYYATLESGHLHLWTVAQLHSIVTAHGLDVTTARTEDLYGYTRPDSIIDEFIAKVSPHRELMNEAVIIEARKARSVAGPIYPKDIFPDGRPVQFAGAIVSFSQARREQHDNGS